MAYVLLDDKSTIFVISFHLAAGHNCYSSHLLTIQGCAEYCVEVNAFIHELVSNVVLFISFFLMEKRIEIILM